MKIGCSCAATLLGVMLPLLAIAQPELVSPEEEPTSSPAPRVAPKEKQTPPPVPYHDTQEYRRGLRLKSAGTWTMSLGAGIGAPTLIVAGLLYWVCFHGESCNHSRIDYIAIAGGSAIALGLAVGLPLYFVGRARLSRIRQRHRTWMPRVGFTGRGVSVHWTF